VSFYLSTCSEIREELVDGLGDLGKKIKDCPIKFITNFDEMNVEDEMRNCTSASLSRAWEDSEQMKLKLRRWRRRGKRERGRR